MPHTGDSTKHLSYHQIAQDIESRILSRELPGGTRLPAEAEQARMIGVNITTIRRALAQLEKKGLILRQRGRGTFVCEKSTRAQNILYVGPVDGHVFSSLFAALSRAAQRTGCRLTPMSPSTLSKEHWQKEVNPHIGETDAILVHDAPCAEWLRHAPDSPCRIIEIVNWIEPAARLPVAVGFDYDSAVALAIAHLTKHGHHRIGLLTHAWDSQKDQEGGDLPKSNRGLFAYRKAMAFTEGTPCIFEMPPKAEDLSAARKSITKLARLLRSPDAPSAFLCDGDHRALHLYSAAAEAGLHVPEDISAVGLGDTPWATEFTPSLTSIRFNEEGVADLAIRLCREPSLEAPHLFCRVAPALYARESVAECSR